MSVISAHELSTNVSDVLRRVEAGEHLRITVSGRPVAELIPLSQRPSSLDWDTFMRGHDDWQADSELSKDLADILFETTDDLPLQ